MCIFLNFKLTDSKLPGQSPILKSLYFNIFFKFNITYYISRVCIWPTVNELEMVFIQKMSAYINVLKILLAKQE